MATNILIVDDSATIRAMVKKSLELTLVDIGRIHEAGDGIAALALLADHKVDLVLADINMPRLDGVQLVTTMKRDPALANVPIIIISTEGSKERLNILRERGVVGFLHKPFRPEQLKELISKIVELPNDSHSEEPVSYDF